MGWRTQAGTEVWPLRANVGTLPHLLGMTPWGTLFISFLKKKLGKALNMGCKNWISLLASLQMYRVFPSVFLAIEWISWEAV